MSVRMGRDGSTGGRGWSHRLHVARHGTVHPPQQRVAMHSQLRSMEADRDPGSWPSVLNPTHWLGMAGAGLPALAAEMETLLGMVPVGELTLKRNGKSASSST